MGKEIQPSDVAKLYNLLWTGLRFNTTENFFHLDAQQRLMHGESLLVSGKHNIYLLGEEGFDETILGEAFHPLVESRLSSKPSRMLSTYTSKLAIPLEFYFKTLYRYIAKLALSGKVSEDASDEVLRILLDIKTIRGGKTADKVVKDICRCVDKKTSKLPFTSIKLINRDIEGVNHRCARLSLPYFEHIVGLKDTDNLFKGRKDIPTIAKGIAAYLVKTYSGIYASDAKEAPYTMSLFELLEATFKQINIDFVATGAIEELACDPIDPELIALLANRDWPELAHKFYGKTLSGNQGSFAAYGTKEDPDVESVSDIAPIKTTVPVPKVSPEVAKNALKQIALNGATEVITDEQVHQAIEEEKESFQDFFARINPGNPANIVNVPAPLEMTFSKKPETPKGNEDMQVTNSSTPRRQVQTNNDGLAVANAPMSNNTNSDGLVIHDTANDLVPVIDARTGQSINYPNGQPYTIKRSVLEKHTRNNKGFTHRQAGNGSFEYTEDGIPVLEIIQTNGQQQNGFTNPNMGGMNPNFANMIQHSNPAQSFYGTPSNNMMNGYMMGGQMGMANGVPVNGFASAAWNNIGKPIQQPQQNQGGWQQPMQMNNGWGQPQQQMMQGQRPPYQPVGNTTIQTQQGMMTVPVDAYGNVYLNGQWMRTNMQPQQQQPVQNYNASGYTNAVAFGQ